MSASPPPSSSDPPSSDPLSSNSHPRGRVAVAPTPPSVEPRHGQCQLFFMVIKPEHDCVHVVWIFQLEVEKRSSPRATTKKGKNTQTDVHECTHRLLLVGRAVSASPPPFLSHPPSLIPPSSNLHSPRPCHYHSNPALRRAAPGPMPTTPRGAQARA